MCHSVVVTMVTASLPKLHVCGVQVLSRESQTQSNEHEREEDCSLTGGGIQILNGAYRYISTSLNLV